MNIKMVEFALGSLMRRRWKNLSVFFVFTVLVFLVTAIFSIAASLKAELLSTLQALPEVTVQRMVGGRQSLIPEERAYAIAAISGVEKATPRVWGYYYFEKAGVNFTLVGVDFLLPGYKESIARIVSTLDEEILRQDEPFMIAGEGVKKVLEANYYKEDFNFIKPDGNIVTVKLAGTFKGETALESNDVIFLSQDTAREILDAPAAQATDIVVKIANPTEIPMIVQKISQMYPDCRVVSRSDLAASYQNLFDYKGGLFLALLVTSFFAFFVLVFDKASGLNQEERREIGIMKALGWKTSDVLKMKFFESMIMSFFAFAFGVMFALGYVYLLQAPVLRELFSGFSVLKPPFGLQFVFDAMAISLVFLATVPFYIAATIIPSWKASIIDADEVMR